MRVPKSFMVDADTAGAMRMVRGVDWDSVVSLAIHTKLRTLRQTATMPAVVSVAPVASTAVMARPMKPSRPKAARPRDPSPDEILRRAAEIRAGR